MAVFVVLVGYTVRRPVVPDERFSRVVVAADWGIEATLIAAQVVAVHPYCEMVTSTLLVSETNPVV